jgi:hypothetical protein
MFPGCVRSGFLWWQLDTAYGLILVVKCFGGSADMCDYKARCLEKYERPNIVAKRSGASAQPVVAAPFNAFATVEDEEVSKLRGIPDVNLPPAA